MPPPTPSSDTHFQTGNVQKTKSNGEIGTRDFVELATRPQPQHHPQTPIFKLAMYERQRQIEGQRQETL